MRPLIADELLSMDPGPTLLPPCGQTWLSREAGERREDRRQIHRVRLENETSPSYLIAHLRVEERVIILN